MHVTVHLLDKLTGERAAYSPPFDYDDDDNASGGWELSNDMCDGNRLDHIADCNGHPREKDHTCGMERCFIQIVDAETGRVIYEEDEWTPPAVP